MTAVMVSLIFHQVWLPQAVQMMKNRLAQAYTLQVWCAKYFALISHAAV